MWYCESGCMEQRPGEMTFALDEHDWAYWRQRQGVPTNWATGFHIVCCSECANLFEVWIKDQPWWFEYMRLKAAEARIKGELKTGKRDPKEIEAEMVDHDKNVELPFVQKHIVFVQKWWDTRRVEIGAMNDKRKAEEKAKKEKKDAEKAEARKAKQA